MSHRTSGREIRPRRAFTIVEILVVIGVLGLLLGILLPALSGAQKRSRKHKELNSIRQVGLAWNLYSNGNNDKLLPGFLDIPVQKKWRVSYEYPNRKDIPPAPGFGASEQNIAGPWTWRLMPYLDYNHDVVHGYAEEPEFDAVLLGEDAEEAGEIAVFPSFGYNAYYVGGWWTMESGFARPRFYDVPVYQTANDPDPQSRNLVSQSVGTIQRSTELITFCSSSTLTPGLYRKFPNEQEGSYWVSPSWLGPDQQWQWVGAVEVFVTTAAPIGRYNGLAATLYADGHTAGNQLDELDDPRHWIDKAEHREFRHD